MLIYKKMGYLAVNVGPNDVKAGVPFLKQNNSVPWISSNFYSSSGESYFSQYVTQNIDGLRIGVLGVTALPPNLEKDVDFRNWHDVLPGIIKKASNNCDFIILLSALPQNENNKIANQFSEIRLIISATPSRGNVSPQAINNAILTQTEKRGKFLGILSIFNGHSTTWKKDYQYEINMQRRKLASFDRRISKLINSSEQSKDILHNLNRLQPQKESVEKLIEKLEAENRTMLEADISTSTYNSRFIALTSNIPEDEEIAGEIRVIKNNIHNLNTLKSKKAHSKKAINK